MRKRLAGLAGAVGASIRRRAAPLRAAVGRLGPVGQAAAAAVLALVAVAGVIVGAWWFVGDTGSATRVGGALPLPASPGTVAEPALPVTVTPGLGLSVPATSATAFAAIPPVRRVEPLAEAADPALLDATAQPAPLPRIAADGRQPWQAYGRPFDRGDDRPRLVIIIAGLGLSVAASEAAVQRLPGAVTLAFDPLAPMIAADVAAARRFGHETLTLLALEAQAFPFEDQGPAAIRADERPAATLPRLDAVLAAAPTSVGVLATGGGGFARAAEAATPLLRRLKERGLLLVDATGGGAALLAREAAALDLPRVYVDLIIDEPAAAAAIDGQLARLERLARERLVAVGLGRPLPATLARIRAWADTLDDRGLVLAPATAAVGSQFREHR